jgi:hypothetical protein
MGLLKTPIFWGVLLFFFLLKTNEALFSETTRRNIPEDLFINPLTPNDL